MEPLTGHSIPAAPDMKWMLRKLGDTKTAQKFLSRLKPLMEEAGDIEGAVGIFKPVSVVLEGDDRVVLDDVVLESRVLRVNLGGTDRAFAFVGTCGQSLTRWMLSKENLLERYLAGVVLDGILASALNEFFRRIAESFSLEKTAVMTPGSLEDWPLSQQQKIFALLGDAAAENGVRLTASMMMDPMHSVSGVLFPTEDDFVSCMLCPKVNCPDRRAAFEHHLYDEKYRPV